MRHVGHEVLAHLLQVVDPGHVAHEHQPPAAAVGDDPDEKVQLLALRGGHVQGLVERLDAECVGEGRMADEVGDRLADVARTLEAQQPVRRLVHPQDRAVAVEDDRTVRHRFGRLLESNHDLAQALLPLAVLAMDTAQGFEDLRPDPAGVRLGLAAAARQPAGEQMHVVDVPCDVRAGAREQQPGGEPEQMVRNREHRRPRDEAAPFPGAGARQGHRIGPRVAAAGRIPRSGALCRTAFRLRAGPRLPRTPRHATPRTAHAGCRENR